MIEMVSAIIAGVAVVVAVVFGIRNHRLGKQNSDLQKRLLALEESRENDRIREAAKANLVADILRGDGTGPAWRLEIENRGRAEARDVTVMLEGQPILDHPGVAPATRQGLNQQLCHLPGGARFRYVLAPSLQCRPPWELYITWTDDSGEPGAYQTTLTF